MHVLQEVREYFKHFVDRRRAAPEEEAVDLPGVEGGGVLAEVRRVKIKLEYQSMGVMLTYNGSAGVMRETSDELADKFRAWVLEKQEVVGFKRYSATCEASLRSGKTISFEDILGHDVPVVIDEAQPQRRHLHLFLEWPCAGPRDKDVILEQCTFDGMVPHAHFNASRGYAVRRSLDRSHFYCRAEKMGSVWFFGNYLPWNEWNVDASANYRPEGKWIDDLWSSHKLDHDIYIKYAEFVLVDFPRRKQCWDSVMSSLRTRKLEKEAAKRQDLLEKQYAPSITLDCVDGWKQS